MVSEDLTQQYENNIFNQKSNPGQEVTTPAFNQNKEISFPEKNKSDVKQIVLPPNLHSNGQKDFASPKSFGTFQQGGLKNFYESVPKGMNFTLGRNELKNKDLQVDESVHEDDSVSEALPENKVMKVDDESQGQLGAVNEETKELINGIIDQVEDAVDVVKKEIEEIPHQENTETVEEITEETIEETKKINQIKEVKKEIIIPPKKSKVAVNQWDDGENSKTLSFLKPKTTNKKYRNQKKYKKGYQNKKSYNS